MGVVYDLTLLDLNAYARFPAPSLLKELGTKHKNLNAKGLTHFNLKTLCREFTLYFQQFKTSDQDQQEPSDLGLYCWNM